MAWGAPRTVSNELVTAKYLPSVHTKGCWDTAKPGDPVEKIYLFDCIGDREEADRILSSLNRLHLGLSYSEWLRES